MKSRVHPKYKTKYRVGNWRAYERSLVQRGDVTFWLSADARAAWRPAPSGRAGGPKRFSDLAIKTALTLRLVFPLPLRQAEGFLRSVLSMLDVDLEARTTLRFLAGVGTLTSSYAVSRPTGGSTSSSIARASLLEAKVNGPRRSTAVAANEAGRSSISASTGLV